MRYSILLKLPYFDATLCTYAQLVLGNSDSIVKNEYQHFAEGMLCYHSTKSGQFYHDERYGTLRLSQDLQVLRQNNGRIGAYIFRYMHSREHCHDNITSIGSCFVKPATSFVVDR